MEDHCDSAEAKETLKTANEFCMLMDMTITMIGQAFNSVSYYRRRNALMSLMENAKKVKETLNENKNFFQENHSEKLFGDKFDEHIVDQLKLKKDPRNSSMW